MENSLTVGSWYNVRYLSESFVHDYGYWIMHESTIAFEIFEHPQNGTYLYVPVLGDEKHWRIEEIKT